LPTNDAYRRHFMIANFVHLLRDESGQDLIEYALVAALIALGAIAAMQGLANGISTAFSAVSSDLSSAVA
jgi:pilus assembly protein Flp/PilA